LSARSRAPRDVCGLAAAPNASRVGQIIIRERDDKKAAADQENDRVQFDNRR
jgi:hypothetical protein